MIDLNIPADTELTIMREQLLIDVPVYEIGVGDMVRFGAHDSWLVVQTKPMRSEDLLAGRFCQEGIWYFKSEGTIYLIGPKPLAPITAIEVPLTQEDEIQTLVTEITTTPDFLKLL